MEPVVYNKNYFDKIKSITSDKLVLKIAEDLHVKGYSIFDFPEIDFEYIAKDIKDTLIKKFDINHWRENDWKNNSGLRVQDEWVSNVSVKKLAVNKKIIEILSTCFGKKAFPFQTLNFPVGTQQPKHMDAFHFSSIPKNFMCGVWIALEDVFEDSGPLELYESSHQLELIITKELKETPNLTFDKKQEIYQNIWDEQIKNNNLKPMSFIAKKGECVIWLANLLHGGAKQNNPNLTRWSQVTHYYFHGCEYIIPARTNFNKKTFFYKENIHDISNGKKITNNFFNKFRNLLS